MQREDWDFEFALGTLRLYLPQMVACFSVIIVAGIFVVMCFSPMPSWPMIFRIFLAFILVGLSNSLRTHDRMKELVSLLPARAEEPGAILFIHYFFTPLNFAFYSTHFFLIGMWLGWILK